MFVKRLINVMNLHNYIVPKEFIRYNHAMEIKPEEKQNSNQETKGARALAALKELGHTALGFGKAQLILFGVNFVVITIGMIIAGLGWWSPLVAVAISLLDLLPVIGSGIVFVLRMILDPIITGKSVGLSPWITLAASVGGLILFGGAGMILGPVIAAVANVLFRVFFKKKTQGEAKATDSNPDKTE